MKKKKEEEEKKKSYIFPKLSRLTRVYTDPRAYKLLLNYFLKASECFILVGSAMFGATFNLVTRVGLP